MGGLYEERRTAAGGVSLRTRYYAAAGAVRQGSTLTYVLADHLGSATVAVSPDGATVRGERRYFPFGETRDAATSGLMPSDRLYTGQRALPGLGLYHFGARFYAPGLGRFISADTVVPDWADPQSLNRYAFVVNNPLKYTDPTGHEYCYGTGLEIGVDISQADCWAYGRDKWMLGIPVEAPVAGQGYDSIAAVAGLLVFQVGLTPEQSLQLWSDLDSIGDFFEFLGIAEAVASLGGLLISKSGFNLGINPVNLSIIAAAFGAAVAPEAIAAAAFGAAIVVSVAAIVTYMALQELGSVSDLLVSSGALNQPSVLSVSYAGIWVYSLDVYREEEWTRSTTWGATNITPLILFWWASDNLPGQWAW